MKLGIVSDLHLEFRPKGVADLPGRFVLHGGVHLQDQVDMDALIVAGDLHPSPLIRDQALADLERHYQVPVLFVTGNHDYYHGALGLFETKVTLGGVRVSLTTLWTALKPADMRYAAGLTDFRVIRGISFDAWNAMFARNLQFLKDNPAEVIVTHHCPFPGSIHPKFAGDTLNPFFCNALDPADFPEARLWVHGHTHESFDYQAGKIRVVCNPLGYPHERRAVDIQVVEI